MKIQTFFRPQLNENFPSYAPSVRWDRKTLKLDSGENFWSPKLDLDWNVLLSDVACYPDASARELREAIAKDLEVALDCIAIGNGSDELIDLCCRLFLDPGDLMVNFPPTFPMFSFFAKLSGATVLDIPRLDNFELDLKVAKKRMKRSKLVFLDNPSNPTGTLVSRKDIMELLSVGTPLVVDEAYFEFAGESVVDLVSEVENLIVLRTFSKWSGIAGLRVGFMVASPTVIRKILAIKAPYNVNVISQRVALKVLENKTLFIPAIEAIKESRDWFVDQVNRIDGLQAIPSRASCVSVRSKDLKATEIADMLAKSGILVKVLPETLLPNALRISIAPRNEMERVVRVLRELNKRSQSRIHRIDSRLRGNRGKMI